MEYDLACYLRLCFCLQLFCCYPGRWAIGSMYPRESVTREVKRLDGIWDFRISPPDDQAIGFREKWYATSLRKTGKVISMPVPSSYNDITQEVGIRDFVGWAWYEKQFFVPKSWLTDERSVILRFGSINYFGAIFVNSANCINHTGGHLPFQVDITKLLEYSQINLLTVAVNNTLTVDTIPQGDVVYPNDPDRYPRGFHKITLNFDFFNYAGIHRSVFLYAIPSAHITDITFVPGMSDPSTGLIDYSVLYEDQSKLNYEQISCHLKVYNQTDEEVVADAKGCAGTIKIDNPTLWWPFMMDPNPGHLYRVMVIIKNGTQELDVYEEKCGIRSISFDDKNFMINGRPFYFRGFGKHEDSDIRGRGLDLPLIIKDFNLIKWTGANSFRTSHYPYSEELMDEADKQGIVVIDECPAVGLSSFTNTLLKQHMQTIKEMIQRDKNRPSVVMWSIANEPRSSLPSASDYFEQIVNLVKSLDNTRPITAALNARLDKDLLGQYLDILMINRYYAWYSDTGYTQVIRKQITREFTDWHEKHKKLVMISEYGADTISGFHRDPSFVFTEDYQTEYLNEHHKAFDELIQKGFFIGELVWNFADFMTGQEVNRVNGNKKGIFTRAREPKSSARFLKCRYMMLANFTTNFLDEHVYCPVRYVN